ncbi:MAG: hypothetical protein Tsb0013_18700 [Phycisphaerales bacterium]
MTMAKRTTKRRVTKKRTTKKRVTKKAATRRPAAKKTTKKTTAAAHKPAKITAAKEKARTKSEVLSVLADQAGISKKEVQAVFDAMAEMIKMDLKKGNAGVFNVPGMMKVTVQRKPATKARKGINPFTGEETIFKAKPARNVVKVRPLKALKELV